MSAELGPGQFQVQAAEPKSLDELLAGPCPVPDNFPPGLRRRFRCGWVGLRGVRSTYRPGYVALMVEVGAQLRGQFLPVDAVRSFLADDAPPTVGQLLTLAGPEQLIVVLRARRAVAGFALLQGEDFAAPPASVGPVRGLA